MKYRTIVADPPKARVCTCPGACELGMGPWGSLVIAVIFGVFLLSPVWVVALVMWLQ